jgi:hypothetical protein
MCLLLSLKEVLAKQKADQDLTGLKGSREESRIKMEKERIMIKS